MIYRTEYFQNELNIFWTVDDFDALSSYLAHVLLYPRQIFVHPGWTEGVIFYKICFWSFGQAGIQYTNILSPGVNPWKIVTSTLNPKTGHSHNCVAPTKVSEIHINYCEAWQVMTHLEKSPPPESPLQVSLVPSPAHSLVAPIVTRLTCR